MPNWKETGTTMATKTDCNILYLWNYNSTTMPTQYYPNNNMLVEQKQLFRGRCGGGGAEANLTSTRSSCCGCRCLYHLSLSAVQRRLDHKNSSFILYWYFIGSCLHWRYHCMRRGELETRRRPLPATASAITFGSFGKHEPRDFTDAVTLMAASQPDWRRVHFCR